MSPLPVCLVLVTRVMKEKKNFPSQSLEALRILDRALASEILESALASEILDRALASEILESALVLAMVEAVGVLVVLGYQLVSRVVRTLDFPK